MMTRMMITRRTLAGLALAALAAALFGCGAFGTGPDTVMVETADLLQVAHYDDVLFLRMTEPKADGMDALFQGLVDVDDAGCVRLETQGDYQTQADYRVTVVWPFGYALERFGGGLQVLDADGVAVATLGEDIEVSGGEVTELHDGLGFSAADRQLAQDRCPGRFWIVADVL